MSGPVRVLVAEDEQPLRDAICDLIASEEGLEVAGAASTAAEAVDLAAATRPDVALVDVRMPGGGAEAARSMRERSPDTVVLALSAYEDQATVLEMLRAGGGRLSRQGDLAGRDRRLDQARHARPGQPVRRRDRGRRRRARR